MLSLLLLLGRLYRLRREHLMYQNNGTGTPGTLNFNWLHYSCLNSRLNELTGDDKRC